MMQRFRKAAGFVAAGGIVCGSLHAQPSSDGLWAAVPRTVNLAEVPAELESVVWPAVGPHSLLDVSRLEPLLAQAPKEGAGATGIVMTLPLPEGGFGRFRIHETAVMHPALAAKFPEIKTYAGNGLDDTSASVRIDWTPQGLRAQILSDRGARYVDPVFDGDVSTYVSYFKKDYASKAKQSIRCSFKRPSVPVPQSVSEEVPAVGPVSSEDTVSSGGTLHTFRLAVACTGEYAAYHGGTVPAAMAAIVTTMNRVNGIFEQETGVRMQLVANNDLLVFTDAGTDPYTNEDGGVMLDENQAYIDATIGLGNYDIGHVFSTGGGGIAGFGVVCGSRKAEGVTGRPQPDGDPFDVDFVAHEMGHQFRCDHTFNGDSGSCGGNREATTAYEPGSGTTIMGYAGICGNDNVQGSSDPYFHSDSVESIVTFVAGLSCQTQTANGNTAPVVAAGDDVAIPANTPFELVAVGSDADMDPLTYTWEQRDLGAQQDLNAGDTGAGPLFRSWAPTSSPSRTLPRLTELLKNTTPVGEQLPSVARTAMNWRVVARDNRAVGGGVAWDDKVVQVINSSGFRVTFPNTALTLSGGQTITWQVAGTTDAPVSAATVSILLSTDGGFTYPTVLVANTANDGSAAVVLPDINASTARIRVQADGNIFFDISDADFVIEPSGGLAVTPVAGWEAVGVEGGPFLPANKTYTLRNNLGVPMPWSAATDVPWAAVDVASGTINPGQTVDLTVSVTAPANSLPVGQALGRLVVSNSVAGVSQSRVLRVEVVPVGGLLAFRAIPDPVSEGAGLISFEVKRTGSSAGPVSVQWNTANDSAVAGQDYGADSGVLSWADGEGGIKTGSVVVLEDTDVEPLETFTIRLSAPTGGAGLGTLDEVDAGILDNDSNDQCAGSLVITSLPFSGSYDTSDATSTGDPDLDCIGGAANGIWFTYTASEGGLLSIDTDGSDFDTAIGIFEGSCGSLIALECNDDSGFGTSSAANVLVTAGQTLHFLVGGYNGAVGDLDLNLSLEVGGTLLAGDVCDDAVEIFYSPFSDQVDTTSATGANEAASCVDNFGAGVWYTFQPAADGRLTIDLIDSDYDTGLAVFTGDCANLVEIQCNEDEDFDGGVFTSYLQFNVIAGTRYYISCGGFGGDTGNLDVAIQFERCTPVCENDTDFDGIVDSLDDDRDGDVMPNAWEIARGLNPDRPEDGGVDGDIDGFTNTEEYIAGTIHTNGMSYLRFDVPHGAGTPGQMPVRFDSVNGRVYHIDYRPDLDSGSWLHGPAGIVGDGSQKTILLNTNHPRLHIRLGVDLVAP